MALADVIAEMRADLAAAGIVTDEEIPEHPPDLLGDYPKLLIYPQPDAWGWHSHAGDNGRGVYGGEHTIVVEWHTRLVDLAQAVAETTPVVDAIPAALFAGFARDRFDGTVTLLRGVRCETFGQLDWGTDKTFGTRLLVDVTVYEEVPGDG